MKQSKEEMIKEIESVLLENHMDEPTLMAIFHSFMDKCHDEYPDFHVAAGQHGDNPFMAYDFGRTLSIVEMDYPFLKVMVNNTKSGLSTTLDFSPNISIGLQDGSWKEMVDEVASYLWVQLAILHEFKDNPISEEEFDSFFNRHKTE